MTTDFPSKASSSSSEHIRRSSLPTWLRRSGDMAAVGVMTSNGSLTSPPTSHLFSRIVVEQECSSSRICVAMPNLQSVSLFSCLGFRKINESSVPQEKRGLTTLSLEILNSTQPRIRMGLVLAKGNEVTSKNQAP